MPSARIESVQLAEGAADAFTFLVKVRDGDDTASYIASVSHTQGDEAGFGAKRPSAAWVADAFRNQIVSRLANDESVLQQLGATAPFVLAAN